MAVTAQLSTEDAQEIGLHVHRARGEARKLLNQTRRTQRALATLEAALAERGIELDITAQGSTDD